MSAEPMPQVRPVEISPKPPFPVKPTEFVPKPQPEQVRVKLGADLDQLKAQKAKLEYDLIHHNCIRLDVLTKDFDGEIGRLQKAIQALQEGKPQGAIVHLEEQAARNFKNFEELKTSQIELTAEYTKIEASLRKAQEERASALSPQDRNRLANDEVVMKEWVQLEGKRIDWEIRAEHPDWFNGPNGSLLSDKKYQGMLAAERARLQRLHNLKAPEQIMQDALKQGVDPKEAYVSLRMAGIKAHKEWRRQADNLEGAQRQIIVENLNLDGMIISLGGTPKFSERAQRAQIILAKESLDPRKLYEGMLLNVQRSPQLVEQQMVNTYLRLENEQREITASLSAAMGAGNEKAIRALRRRETRNAILVWRLQEAFKIHCEQQKKQVSLPQLAEVYQQVPPNAVPVQVAATEASASAEKITAPGVLAKLGKPEYIGRVSINTAPIAGDIVVSAKAKSSKVDLGETITQAENGAVICQGGQDVIGAEMFHGGRIKCILVAADGCSFGDRVNSAKAARIAVEESLNHGRRIANDLLLDRDGIMDQLDIAIRSAHARILQEVPGGTTTAVITALAEEIVDGKPQLYLYVTSVGDPNVVVMGIDQNNHPQVRRIVEPADKADAMLRQKGIDPEQIANNLRVMERQKLIEEMTLNFVKNAGMAEDVAYATVVKHLTESGIFDYLGKDSGGTEGKANVRKFRVNLSADRRGYQNLKVMACSDNLGDKVGIDQLTEKYGNGTKSNEQMMAEFLKLMSEQDLDDGCGAVASIDNRML